MTLVVVNSISGFCDISLCSAIIELAEVVATICIVFVDFCCQIVDRSLNSFDIGIALGEVTLCQLSLNCIKRVLKTLNVSISLSLGSLLNFHQGNITRNNGFNVSLSSLDGADIFGHLVRTFLVGIKRLV